MPRERARSVVVTAVLSCLVVGLAYALLGAVGAGILALAAYGVGVFVLGLVNAGAVAAALMATLTLVVAIDPALDEDEPPPERAQLRDALTNLQESAERHLRARSRAEAVEAQAVTLRDRAGSSADRAERLEAEVRRLRRALRRARD